MKPVNSEFVNGKVEGCRRNLNLLTTVRNVVVICIAVVTCVTDLLCHRCKSGIQSGVIWLIYFYGIVALAYISLQIYFSIVEHTKYLTILEKCENKILTEAEQEKLRYEIATVVQHKATILITMSLLLNTMPIALLVGLLTISF